MKVICNTTVISNFAAVNALAILRDVVRELHISTEVYAEIQDGLADGCDFYEGLDAQIYPIAPDGWLHLTAFENDAELRLYGQLPTALHRGEASSLAIAAQREWAFLSDDDRARKTARQLGVPVSGTLGVLAQAVEFQHVSLTAADDLLTKMIAAGYRSPLRSVTELL